MRATVVRGALLALLLAAVASPALAADNGPLLLDLFERTCGQRPGLATQVQRLAVAAGFESEDGGVGPELETGETLDVLYFARLKSDPDNVTLDAYVSGRRTAPTVSCTLTAKGVEARELIPAVEAAEHVASPKTETSNDGAQTRLTWPLSAEGSGQWLELTFRPAKQGRASLNLTYVAGGR